MARPDPGPRAQAGAVAAGFDAAAEDYDATGTEFFAHLARRLVDLAGIRPGATVLEVGCGKGAATVPAAQAAGPQGQVTAVDASAAMLAHAAAAVGRNGLANVTLLRADATDPPLRPGGVDVVLASSVIQFLDEPRQAVRLWLPLLRPGGTLALSWGMTQDPGWLPVMAALDAAVPAPVPGFEAFLRRPPFDSPGRLERMLSECGYEDAVTHAEQITTVYADEMQWWNACLGQAPWAVAWRHIPPAALPAARAEAFRLLDGIRGPDGRLTRTLGFGYTIARRPAAFQIIRRPDVAS
jgi:ubiquinone/menaquinone biosynthesis C-methylase UbiE